MNNLLYKPGRRHPADQMVAMYDECKELVATFAAAQSGALDERIAEFKAERALLEEIAGAAKTIEEAKAYADELVNAARAKVAALEHQASKAEQDAEQAKAHATATIENARADADNIVQMAEAQRQAVLQQASAAQARLDQLKADAEAMVEKCAKLERQTETQEHALQAFNDALLDAKRKAAEALGL